MFPSFLPSPQRDRSSRELSSLRGPLSQNYPHSCAPCTRSVDMAVWEDRSVQTQFGKICSVQIKWI